jgi:hypothetical protein
MLFVRAPRKRRNLIVRVQVRSNPSHHEYYSVLYFALFSVRETPRLLFLVTHDHSIMIPCHPPGNLNQGSQHTYHKGVINPMNESTLSLRLLRPSKTKS